MDRIEKIKQLQNNPYKGKKSPSSVINNFFALLTIVLVSVCIILYITYILPAQKAKAKRELELKKHQEFIQMRKKQIALSHKLNKKESNNNDNKK